MCIHIHLIDRWAKDELDEKRRVWRREGIAHHTKHTISSAWSWTYDCQWSWFPYIYPVLLPQWVLKCIGLYYLFKFSQILLNGMNSSSPFRWTIGISKSPDLSPFERAHHMLRTKLKLKHPKNKQELKTTAVKAWHSITKEDAQLVYPVMYMGSSFQAVIDYKAFAFTHLKWQFNFMIGITSAFLKLGGYVWKWLIVIPTPFT